MAERNIPVPRDVPALLRYGVAVAAVAVAVLAELPLGLNAFVGPVFFLAVILSAWFGGGRPGLVAAALATLALAYFFLPPLHSLRIDAPNRIPLLLFVLSAVLVSWLSAAMHRTLVQLQRARHELETRVQERTADLERSNAWLRDSEAKLEQAQRIAHVGYWDRDLDTDRVNWSHEIYRIYGLVPQEGALTAAAVWELIHPDDRPSVSAAMAQVRQGGARYDVEYRIVRPGGEVRSVHSEADVVMDESGRPRRLFGIAQDITDRKQVEDKLRAEIAERTRVEDTLREQAALLDLTHDTVFARDMRDVITYWNDGAKELYGWDRHEIVGKTSHEVTKTVFPAPLSDINRTLLDTGRWEGQLVHTKRDGSQVVVASRWALQRDGHGRPVAILETNNDITEQRRAEEALRESEEQWRAVFENNPTMYFMVDAAGTIVSVNPFGAEQLGYTVGELTGRPVLDVFHEADREGVQRNVAACLDQPGRAVSWEFRKLRKDGSLLWVRETARAMLLKGRAVVLVVCEDVTERKRAEEALRSTQQRLGTVIANSPIILFALDRSGVFTVSEGKGLDVLGSKPGEVVGRSVFDVYGGLPHAVSAVSRALAGEAHTEVLEVRDLVFETHFRPYFDPQGAVAGVNGVATDITERRRAERALRESEERYRNIFEAAGVSIWEEDFSEVQAAIEELKAGGVHGFREYLAGHPEFVRRAISMVKVLNVNQGTVTLFAAKSKDELLTSLERIFLPETEEVFRGELIAVAERRTYFESETVLQTLTGKRLTVLFTITFPPPPGRPDRVLVTITDITERKRADEALQKAQAELAHVTRVTTMGEMASSIAHEVNQPLAAVTTTGSAGLRWLASEPPNLEKARTCLTRIVRDAARASEVIARIRNLVKKSPPAEESVDVTEAIQDVLAMANAEARRHHVSVRTQGAGDVPPAFGDRIQLQQVILNLVMNAIEAMKAVTGRPRELLIRCEQNEPGTILVVVRDSGIGVDPQGTDRIFDAFYTTKPDGLGMGLSISRSIIEAHGGRLWTVANDDHGATFQLTLPTARGVDHD